MVVCYKVIQLKNTGCVENGKRFQGFLLESAIFVGFLKRRHLSGSFWEFSKDVGGTNKI